MPGREVTSREKGLRRAGGITAALAAAGVAGTVLVACTVGTDSSASTSSNSNSSTSDSSSTDSGKSSSDYNGRVSGDSGSSSGADAGSGGS
jgi:hypothetical protein